MSVKMSCTGCRTSIVQTRSPRRTIIPRKPGAVDARTPIFAFGAAECRSRRIPNGQAPPPSAGGAARDGLAYRYDSVSRSAGYDGRSPRRPGARARSPRGSRPDPSRNRGGVAIANRHRDRGPGNPARRTIGHRSARSNHPGRPVSRRVPEGSRARSLRRKSKRRSSFLPPWLIQRSTDNGRNRFPELCGGDVRHFRDRALGARRKSAMLPLPRTAGRRHPLKPCCQTRWKSYRRSRPRIPGSRRAPTAAGICCLFGSGRSIGYAVNSQSRCNMPSTSIFSCSPPWLVRSPWCFPRIVDACLPSHCSGAGA